MRAIRGRWSVGLMLMAVTLLASACFQTANIQPNAGVNLEPVATEVPTDTPAAVQNSPAPLPVLIVTSPPTTIAEEINEDSPTPLPQLSAAQIEATSIVIEATNEAIPTVLPIAAPTKEPLTEDEEPPADDGELVETLDDEVVAAQLAGSCIHIVRTGDTLYGIARQYNSTVTNLVTLNAISNSDVISVGQQITIPNCGTQLTERTNETETASALAVEKPEIAHVVQEGEGLFDIALRYGVSVTAIAQANNISDINTVYLGQVLTIPASQ